MKKSGVSVLFLVLFLLSLSFLSLVSAYEFNGTVYNQSGVRLNNTLVNVTLRNAQFQIIGSNSTFTNASGAFNITVSENATYFYQPSVTLTESGAVQFIGQSLPALDYYTFVELAGINFYLRPAGTINITVYNESWALRPFLYQIVDTQLGYPVAESFTTYVTNAVVSVPRNRNYSIVVYPNQTLPVSYLWNNFSSDSSYNMSTISKNSNYNVTTRTLHKEFNTSMTLVRVTGYLNNATNPIGSWGSLAVVPLILDPGDTVFFDDADLPYNMSAFWTFLGQGNQTGDKYNLSGAGTGWYNISVPAPAEGANYLFFGTGLNVTYYGGYANITGVTYGDAGKSLNISLYGLQGTRENITMSDANTFANINVTTARQSFYFINASNVSLSSISANVKTTVDYSSYGSIKFTFITDVDQDSPSNFTLPLINVTGIKEMNVFTQSYAPRKVSFTASQLLTSQNITFKEFAPGDIDKAVSAANVKLALYFSNSTCDVPNPPTTCLIGATGEHSLSSDNPMASIMGGGKISFRMGTGNISVHFVNVDMLASGPPDALFDSSVNTNASSGDSFSAALRFGSGGPTIYDFVLVGFPYSDGVLNENDTVNISIPAFYDDNWRVIWNVSLNGTDASALAGNYSHYSSFQSQWQVLMNSNNSCGTNSSAITSTAPCYINTSENRIWLRLPEFSGTGPSVTGTAIKAASSSSPSSSSSNTPEGKSPEKEPTVPTAEKIIPSQALDDTLPPEVSLEDYSDWIESGSVSFEAEEGAAYTFSFLNPVSQEEEHRVTVQSVNEEQGFVVLLVESTPQEITLLIGTGKNVDLDGDGQDDVEFILDGISNGFATVRVEKLDTWLEREQASLEEQQALSPFVWVLLAVVLLVILLGIYLLFGRSKGRKR